MIDPDPLRPGRPGSGTVLGRLRARRVVGASGLAAVPVAVLWAVIPAYLLFLFVFGPHVSPGVGSAVTGALMTTVQVVGAALSLRAALRRSVPVEGRRPWRWVSASSVLLILVTVLYSAGLAGRPELMPVAGLLRLLFPVLMLAAVFSFPTTRRSGQERIVLVFDMMMVGGCAFLALWYYLLGPALARGTAPTTVVPAVASPVLDVLMISGACFVLLRGVVEAFRRALVLLVAAAVLLVIPDLYLAYVMTHAADASVNTSNGVVLGAALTTGLTLMALAALHSRAYLPGAAPRSADPSAWVLPYVPYLAVLAGYALLLTAASGYGMFPWGGLAIGTVVMTGGAVVRQLLPLLEHQRLASTDPLTGLANRRSFVLGLGRALDRAARADQQVALLFFDLNGFKRLNDTMGHHAGDAALRHFAMVLKRSVLGRDVVARLGGDEFAIVLGDIRRPGQAVLVAERIIADLQTPVSVADTPYQLRTSIGIALSAPGERNGDDLLNRADLALYDAKRSATVSTWTVYTDDLARSTSAASPDQAPTVAEL